MVRSWTRALVCFPRMEARRLQMISSGIRRDPLPRFVSFSHVVPVFLNGRPDLLALAFVQLPINNAIPLHRTI